MHDSSRGLRRPFDKFAFSVLLLLVLVFFFPLKYNTSPTSGVQFNRGTVVLKRMYYTTWYSGTAADRQLYPGTNRPS